MVCLPAYRIEPPDMLRLQVMKLVPRPPYRIGIHDTLTVRVRGTPPEQPINGYYVVETDGLVTLGPLYGTARVLGLTTEEAAAKIKQALFRVLQKPSVTVELARSASAIEISGAYRVAPDGVVRLRFCGAVHVAGKTVTEASQAIENQLAQYFDSPQVGVEVIGYNSKSYRVIVSGALASREVVQRFPITGNETVLDAIGQIQGLSAVSSKTIWVARPLPGSSGREQILSVNWEAITRGGETATNYQILPGDRIYIADDSLIALNSYINRLVSPIEQLLGVSQLGATTIQSTEVMGRNFNNVQPH
jgi:protein involved in polysaccharide export with SLBB domain